MGPEPEQPFLAGAGADPIWSEPEPESAPGPRTSGAAQKVAAPQHCSQVTSTVNLKQKTSRCASKNQCCGTSCAGTLDFVKFL